MSHVETLERLKKEYEKLNTNYEWFSSEEIESITAAIEALKLIDGARHTYLVKALQSEQLDWLEQCVPVERKEIAEQIRDRVATEFRHAKVFERLTIDIEL
jgi:hypothetical protein